MKTPFLKPVSLFAGITLCLVTTACLRTSTFSADSGELDPGSIDTIRIATRDQHIFVVLTGRKEISSFTESLNEAPYKGPYKGAGWDEITLVGKDSTVRLFTNGTVFGKSGSGSFYQLDPEYDYTTKEPQ